jgi:hypothetical protein
MPPGEIPASSVTVTDLYHELVGMRADVAAMLTKMERVDERAVNSERVVGDHESRLRTLETAVPTSLEGRILALEKFRWQIIGALVVLNVLAVLVEWLIFNTVHK